jgi:predicted DCC family thiol-disulfide oxidoreductase YuxK
VNIILFDDFCNLCNRAVLFIIKRDKQAIFKFASLQSDVGQEIINRLNINSLKINSIIYLKDNKYFLKSSAILNILRDLGGVWRLFYVFIVLPLFIRDTAYNIVAKLRYRLFGKRNRCVIPSDDVKNRFLE